MKKLPIDSSFKKELAEQTAMMSEFSGEDLSRVDAFLLTRIKLADDDLTSLPIYLSTSANAQKALNTYDNYCRLLVLTLKKNLLKIILKCLRKMLKKLLKITT